MTTRIKWALTALAALIAVALVGGTARHPTQPPLPLYYVMGLAATYQTVTPQAASRCDPWATFVDGSFRLRDIQPLPSGFVVSYTIDCVQPGHPPRWVPGYNEFQSTGFRWHSGGGGFGLFEPAAGVPLAYSVSGTYADDDHDGYVIVTGRVLTSTAAIIAVRFSDGEVLTDRVTDSYFAVVMPEPEMPCRLTLRNAQGVVVYGEDLSQGPSPTGRGTCGQGEMQRKRKR